MIYLFVIRKLLFLFLEVSGRNLLEGEGSVEFDEYRG